MKNTTAMNTLTAPAYNPAASHVWGCERHARNGSRICCCAAVKAASERARTISRAYQDAGDQANADRAWAVFDATAAAGCFLVPLGGTFTGPQGAAWIDWLALR